MNKKNIFKLTLLLALPIIATSCRFEDEDFFDESASLRVENTTKSLKDVLVKPENGWVMQYFCGTGVAHFEGFNLFAKFDASMKVTIAGDHRLLRDGNAGKYTESTSLYSLLLEDGPVLAFNTWNDVLTPFVDPVDPWKAPGTLVKDGAGMQGDNNFVIMTYNDNEVIFRGERYNAEVRLVVCDRSWKDYITACNDMKKKITSPSITSFYITDGSDTLYLSGISSGKVRMSERINNPLRNDSLACVFTPNGIRFEKSDTVGRQEFHEFTISSDNSCLTTANKEVSIIPCWDMYMAEHTDKWNMDKSLFNTKQNELFTSIAAELKKFNTNYALENICIGTSTGIQGLVLQFYTDAAKSKINYAAFAMALTRTDYGVVKIALPEIESYDTNLSKIQGKATNIINLCRDFVNTIKGKYRVTPNDYFQPTGGTYTAIEGGTTFKLY